MQTYSDGQFKALQAIVEALRALLQHGPYRKYISLIMQIHQQTLPNNHNKQNVIFSLFQYAFAQQINVDKRNQLSLVKSVLELIFQIVSCENFLLDSFQNKNFIEVYK